MNRSPMPSSSSHTITLIAMIAFWWEDWPGTLLRPPLTGFVDTVLAAVGGIVLTIAGQAVVARVDLRGVFDLTAGAGHAPTFPGTMPLAGAIFVATLELTLPRARELAAIALKQPTAAAVREALEVV